MVDTNGNDPSVSTNETLVYTAAQSMQQLIWVNRGGGIGEHIGRSMGIIQDLSLAPDNFSVAVRGIDEGNANIYIYENGVMGLLTFDPAIEYAPSWSPEGKDIVFVRQGDLFIKRVDGSREAIRIDTGPSEKNNPDWSPDQRYIIYQASAHNTRNDLWYVSVTGDRHPTAFLQTPFDEITPAFSPDGRYVAYASDEEGRYEISVKPFPNGVEQRISSNGGIHPQWIGDELFFVEGDALMSVRVDTRKRFYHSPPQKLFTGQQLGTTLADNETRRYAVASDGRRIMVVRPAEESRLSVMVMENWHRIQDEKAVQ